MNIKFNFFKYLDIRFQEFFLNFVSSEEIPFSVLETDEYVLVCYDSFIQRVVGYTSIPHIQLFLDSDYEKSIIMVNKAWYMNVPVWVTNVFIQHELTRITGAGLHLSKKEFKLYCDQQANRINTDTKAALLWFNDMYPGVVVPSRIEAFLDESDTVDSSFSIASVLI